MLTLKPPVPTGAPEFERVFRSSGSAGDIDQLTRLSAARQALATGKNIHTDPIITLTCWSRGLARARACCRLCCLIMRRLPRT